MARDYYQVLNVPRTADEKEIKKAYRKLARQHHPDINANSKDSEARFKEINEAYQVLSDKEKRVLYDQYGNDFDKIPAGYTGGPPGGGQYAGGVDIGDLFNNARRQKRPGASTRVEEADGAEIGDLFESLFGNLRGSRGGDRQGGRARRGPQKGQDVEHPLEISLEESIKGTQRNLQLTITNADSGENDVRNVTVKIPAGVKEGARVRAANQGSSGSNGGASGDLYLRIHIRPHPFWKREGNDIHCEVPITFLEAALGSQIKVPTINTQVQLKVPPGTQSGQVFRLSGRGVVPVGGGAAGDQFVKVKIMVPKNLAPREEELIKELAQLRTEDVRSQLPSHV